MSKVARAALLTAKSHVPVAHRTPKTNGGANFIPHGDPRRDENFKRWFKASHAVDLDGKPLVLYHGSTATFNRFDPRRSSVESDHGAGFYATNSPHDASHNYAGEGPDLSVKIEREIDRLQDEEFEDEDGNPLTPEQVREMVKDRLGVKHQGAVYPVHMSLQNPVHIGGHRPTFFDLEYPEDDDGGEMKGRLVDFANAAAENAGAYDVDQYSQEELRNAILEHGMEHGGAYVEDLHNLVKKHAPYARYMDTGDVATNEVWRQTLKDLGHDGIIDHTVNKKFGTQRPRGFGGTRIPPMAGMDENTAHYIAFDPSQIKSATGNNGEYGPGPVITEKRGGFIAPQHRSIPEGYADGGSISDDADGEDDDSGPDLTDQGFYSPGAQAARAIPQQRMPPGEITKHLLKTGGVKDEMKWSGVGDQLQGQPGLSPSMDKEDVAQLFEKGLPHLQEHYLKGDDVKWNDEHLNLPGGENYRELVMALGKKPPRLVPLSDVETKAKEIEGAEGRGRTDAVLKAYEHFGIDRENPNFNSKGYFEVPDQMGHNGGPPMDEPSYENDSHWYGIPNPLGHIRIADRDTDDGKKVFNIEELQSDWGQEGRQKGFKGSLTPEQLNDLDQQLDALAEEHKANDTSNESPLQRREKTDEINRREQAILAKKLAHENGLAQAPFVTSTDAWTKFMLKNALIKAAREGHDVLAITPGEVQNDRANIQLDALTFERRGDGVDLIGTLPDGNNQHFGRHAINNLDNVVGHDVAERIRNHPEAAGRLEGDDLKFSVNHVPFYDQKAPSLLQDIIKKLDPSVKIGDFNVGVSHSNDPEDVFFDGKPVFKDLRAHGLALVSGHNGDVFKMAMNAFSNAPFSKEAALGIIKRHISSTKDRMAHLGATHPGYKNHAESLKRAQDAHELLNNEHHRFSMGGMKTFRSMKGILITDKLRKAILKGLPMYRAGGRVGFAGGGGIGDNGGPPLDPDDPGHDTPEGADGVVVGLSNMSNKGSPETAHIDSRGFMVKYDPKLKRKRGKNGQPINELERGPSVGVDKNGNPIPGPYIPENDTVYVAPQHKKLEFAKGGTVNMASDHNKHEPYVMQQFHNAHMFEDPEDQILPIFKHDLGFENKRTPRATGGIVDRALALAAMANNKRK